jgi:glycoside/pentoside/hexuronide:cation symporter, GPH family
VSQALPLTTRLSYALASVATGLFSTVPSVLLVYYGVSILRFDPAFIATLILVPKIAGLLIDPLIGRVFDKLLTSGSQIWRGVLAACAIVLVSAFALLFTPSVAGTHPVALAAAYVVFTIAYSAFAVPYIAVPAQLDLPPNDQTSLVGLRLTFGFAGILAGAAGAPFLISMTGGGAAGYPTMAVICAVVGVLCIAPALLVGPVPDARRGDDAAARLSAPYRNKRFLTLAATYVFATAAFSCLIATLPFVLIGQFNLSESDVGVIMLGCFGIGLVATPVATTVSRRFGLSTVTIIGLGIFASCPIALAILTPASAFISLFMMTAGAGFSFIQLSCFALVAKLVPDNRTGSKQDGGLFTGAFVSLEKFGLATGGALASLAQKDIWGGLAAGTVGLVLVPTILVLFAAVTAISSVKGSKTR